MLVILTKNQVLSPDSVCQNCLLADETGHPRWKKGRLRCGHPIPTRRSEGSDLTEPLGANMAQISPQYQCQMGFRVTQIP